MEFMRLRLELHREACARCAGQHRTRYMPAFASLFFPLRNRSRNSRVRPQTGDTDMVSAARIFFAGMGTVFIILAIGFAGGLMLARSALKEPAGYQTRANTESTTPVRVILPNSA